MAKGRTFPAAGGGGGFTLVELLLALLMTAILAGGLYQALFSGRMAQRRAENSANLNQIGRAVLDMLRRDLESMAQKPGPFNPGLFGKNDEASEYPADSLSFLANSAFPLVTSSRQVDYDAADRAIETDLVQVEWGLGTGEEAGLYRKSKRCLTCTLSDDTPAWRVDNVAYEVVGLNFRYFDGTEWTDEWDSEQSGSFPAAFEVTVVVGLVIRSGGAVSLYDQEGNAVETRAIRIRVTPAAAPREEGGTDASAQGQVQ